MVLATKYLDILLQVENRQLLKEKNKSAIKLLGECVISLVLSHHSKNLKWRTSVTVGYSSVLFSKQRTVHPRGMRMSQPQRKGLNLSWLPSFLSLSPPPAPWAYTMQIELPKSGVFVSPEVLTPVHGFSHAPFSRVFLLFCLLDTTILDSFFLS